MLHAPVNETKSENRQSKKPLAPMPERERYPLSVETLGYQSPVGNGSGSTLQSAAEQYRSHVGSLQRLYGNQAVLQMRSDPGAQLPPLRPLRPSQSGLLQRKCVCGAKISSLSDTCEECSKKQLQAKLAIGASNDLLEQEADRVAEQVMNMAEPGVSSAAAPTNRGAAGNLQRKCACGGSGTSGECDECRQNRDTVLQRSTTGDSGSLAVPPVVHEVLRSPGQPLDSATRSFMEPRFGRDFNDVRLHTDGKVAESARAVNALAYTVGHDVIFGAGQYAPQALEGPRLLAHELAHVIQQSRARSGALVLARQMSKASNNEEGKAPSGEVKVIADKGAGKLRVVLISPDNRILAGLAEITPPPGTALDPQSVQVYAQWSGDAPYPQIRIQTPVAWSSTVNPRQDVGVEQGDSGPFQLTDMTPGEAEQLRQDLIQFVNQTGSALPELAETLISQYQSPTTSPADLRKAAENPEFQNWKSRRAAAIRTNAENAAYQQQLGLEGVSPAEARQITEYYQGRPLRTRWEKDMYVRGTLQQYEELRDVRTGVVFAYRNRQLRAIGEDFQGTEEYVYDINGKLLSAHDLPIKAVYGPQDYVLDPLGLQDLVGIAEADPKLAIATELVTGGAKLAVKGAKGLKMLAQAGKEGVEAVESLAKAGEREAIEEGAGAIRDTTVSAEEVADAVAKSGKAEGVELTEGAVGGSERAADAVAHDAAAEAKAVAREGEAAEGVGHKGEAAGGTDVAGETTPKSDFVESHEANGHEYGVLDNGQVARCSSRCELLRERVETLANGPAKDRAKMQRLLKKLDEIEAIPNRKLKALKAAEFDAEFTASHGPGEWMGDFAVNNMSKEAEAYQRRVTGGKSGYGYYVDKVQFDGYESGKLIEAKYFTKEGRINIDQAWNWNYLEEKAESLREQADRQLKAANGHPIEWRVASKEAAARVKTLLADKLGITVVFTP